MQSNENRVVIFTSNNARILINPENLEELKKLPNCLVNPNCADVAGIPPHLWKIVDGKLARLNMHEQAIREQNINEHGVQNSYSVDSKPIPAKPWYFKPIPLYWVLLINFGCLALQAALQILLK